MGSGGLWWGLVGSGGVWWGLVDLLASPGETNGSEQRSTRSSIISEMHLCQWTGGKDAGCMCGPEVWNENKKVKMRCAVAVLRSSHTLSRLHNLAGSTPLTEIYNLTK